MQWDFKNWLQNPNVIPLSEEKFLFSSTFRKVVWYSIDFHNYRNEKKENQKLKQNNHQTMAWSSKSIPEWRGGPCGRQGRESREDHSHNPSSTYCIHSCENRHGTCNDQRSSLWAEASAKAATCCLPHQDLQHPIQSQKTNLDSQNKPIPQRTSLKFKLKIEHWHPNLHARMQNQKTVSQLITNKTHKEKIQTCSRNRAKSHNPFAKNQTRNRAFVPKMQEKQKPRKANQEPVQLHTMILLLLGLISLTPLSWFSIASLNKP